MDQVSEFAHPRVVHPGEVLVSLGAASIAVGLMWLLASSRGAVGIARADDWSYLLTQFDFGRNGDFILNNWAVTMLIGQTVAAWPVTLLAGESIAWHQAFVAVFAVIALWLTYLLLRRYLSRGWSALSVMTLGLGPLFAPSAISFMTDIPAFTFMVASLFAGAVALDRRNFSWWWFVGSLVLSLIAFTFRDYAIMAGAAVVLVALIRARPSRAALMTILGTGASLVVVAGGLYVWRHSLPNDLKLPGWSFGYSLTLLGRASLTAALLISPALVFISVPAVIRTLLQAKVLAVGSMVLWLALVTVSGLQFLGNVVHPFGTSWLVIGPGVRMWPLWMNRLLILLSAVFLLVLIAFITSVMARLWAVDSSGPARARRVRQWITDQPGLSVILVFPAVLFLAHTFATLALGTWWIDRYFILWVPFACAGVIVLSLRFGWNILALPDPHARTSSVRIVGVGWALAFFVLSFHVVDFDALVDGSKWRAAEEVADATGVDLSDVDGGMPFVAFHEPFIGIGAQDVPTQDGRPWWIERYPGRDFCWTVGFAPNVDLLPPAAEQVSEFRSTFGAGGFVYVVPGPDTCDSPA